MQKIMLTFLLVSLLTLPCANLLSAAETSKNSVSSSTSEKNPNPSEAQNPDKSGQQPQGASAKSAPDQSTTSQASKKSDSSELSSKYYSVSVPPDWKAIMPPTENQGMTSAIFAKNSGSAVVTMVIGSRGGADAKMIAGMFAEQFKADKAPVEKNGQFTFTFTQQGMPCQAWVTTHNDVFMVTSITGNRKEAQNFIKQGIKSTDYAKLLPQF